MFAHFNTPPQHEVYRHAKAGNIDKVRYWLEEQKFPLDKKDFYSNTLLYYACLCEHPNLVAILLDKGAEFSRSTSDGLRTYLASSTQSIRYLLVEGKFAKTEGENIKAAPLVEKWFGDVLSLSTYSDISFTVDGKKITAHKVLLYARVPNLIPKLEKQISITMGNSISEELFISFLKYVYTDKVEVSDENRKPLNQMAKKLGMQALCDYLDKKEVEASCFGNELSIMYNNPIFSDVTLMTDDGDCIHAHKIILSTKSDYFKTFLSELWTDSNTKEMKLVDVPRPVLDVVIKYMYTGTYDVDETNILDVIVVAAQFLMERLKYLLEIDLLRGYLDVDSCIELVSVADMLNCTRLYKASLKSIANNFKALHGTPEFFNLNPDIVKDVYKLVKFED